MPAQPTNHSLSRRTALASLGIGGLGLALATRHLTVFAQDASPEVALPTEGHALVGAWEIDSTDGTPITVPEWAIFDANGTWVHYFSGGFAIGAWRPTAEGTAEGVEIYALFSASLESLLDLSLAVPNPALQQPPIRFRFTVEVGHSGNSFEFAGAVVDEEGKDTGSTGKLTGVRLVAAAP